MLGRGILRVLGIPGSLENDAAVQKELASEPGKQTGSSASVPLPGLQGEQSADSDGGAGQLPGYHVWCGPQTAFTGAQVRSPPPWGVTHLPASVFCAQSPHLNEPLREWLCEF